MEGMDKAIKTTTPGTRPIPPTRFPLGLIMGHRDNDDHQSSKVIFLFENLFRLFFFPPPKYIFGMFPLPSRSKEDRGMIFFLLSAR
jgi:hypothetical protein